MSTATGNSSESSAAVDVILADEQGPAAPPRSNGELVFEEPWESRAFGAAIAMARSGNYEWDTFREHLISEIGEWEDRNPIDSAGEGGETWRYYERWLSALERLLIDRDILSAEEVDERAARVAQEAAHEHDHDHDHEGPEDR